MNLILLFENDFKSCSSNRIRLDDRRREHILTVCRSKVGDRLRVGVWNGMLGYGTITDIKTEFIELEIELTESPPQVLPLTLILSLPRPKSLKKSLEIATCLGIKRIFIIESWRVEKSYWTTPILDEENLRSHIVLGLEQAKDTIPPRIEIRKFFKRFIEDEIESIVKGTTALVGHPYATNPCPYALHAPVTLAIGPEGGFIPYEIDLLEKHGFTAVTLGERILRVEYAIASLSSRLFI